MPFYKASSYDQVFGISDAEVHKQLKDAPEEELKIADLVTWQNWINPSKVIQMMKDIKSGKLKDDTSNDPVLIVSKGDKHVIIGGNHRITALMLTGSKTVKAKHLTL